MMLRITLSLVLICCCMPFLAFSANLMDVQVSNGNNKATINLSFNEQPIYGFFPLSHPERVVLDIDQSQAIPKLPLNFSGNNIVKRIRTSQPKDAKSIRLVLELTQSARIRAVTKKKGNHYNVVFTINGEKTADSKPTLTIKKGSESGDRSQVKNSALYSTSHPSSGDSVTTVSSKRSSEKFERSTRINSAVVVAIDAGHGGQDPGAVGQSGLKEKDVTLAIARKLQILLNNDPIFKGILTREGDYFISVVGRSDMARKQNANLLVSIHADAAPNRTASGASIWVLSNHRANSEMANWLEQHEKQSELLGGAGNLLVKNQTDPYLSQAVLDLQFGHSQRVGYDVAVDVIAQLQRVGTLHKNHPEHASLGVLRSPDIPSLLVETGFISNPAEERLLGSSTYQGKMAKSIYQGLRRYILSHPFQFVPKETGRMMQSVAAEKNMPSNVVLSSASHQVLKYHVVQRGETLTDIAVRYGLSLKQVRSLNSLKKNGILVGQRLKIPLTAIDSGAPKRVQLRNHKVVHGDSLIKIATHYGVSSKAIAHANHLKSTTIMLGQTLTIPNS